VALGKGLPDPVSLDFDDAGIGVAGVGDDAALAAGQAYGGATFFGQGHGQQTHGDAFTNGKQHIQFPPGRGCRGLGSQISKFVGGFAHGADHHDHLKALPLGLGDVTGNFFDAVHSFKAGPAILANQYGAVSSMGVGIHVHHGSSLMEHNWR